MNPLRAPLKGARDCTEVPRGSEPSLRVWQLLAAVARQGGAEFAVKEVKVSRHNMDI